MPRLNFTDSVFSSKTDTTTDAETSVSGMFLVDTTSASITVEFEYRGSATISTFDGSVSIIEVK